MRKFDKRQLENLLVLPRNCCEFHHWLVPEWELQFGIRLYWQKKTTRCQDHFFRFFLVGRYSLQGLQTTDEFGMHHSSGEVIVNYGFLIGTLLSPNFQSGTSFKLQWFLTFFQTPTFSILPFKCGNGNSSVNGDFHWNLRKIICMNRDFDFQPCLTPLRVHQKKRTGAAS